MTFELRQTDLLRRVEADAHTSFRLAANGSGAGEDHLPHLGRHMEKCSDTKHGNEAVECCHHIVHASKHEVNRHEVAKAL